MNVLLIGSGGREHALAWKIATSPLLDKLYCAPGNPGIAEIAEIADIDIAYHAAVVAFCQQKNIDLVMIGPETPLVDGLADSLRNAHIRVVGPGSAAARLEGSKGFMKDLCSRFSIPSAAYGRFKNSANAKSYIRSHGMPIVVKADGLAAGKGVVVAMTEEEALLAVDTCFEGKFGAAGAEVVIEEFLEGEEASFFCLCDGKTAIPLATVQDHKRVGNGNTGPNTGGMGTCSPASIMTPDIIARTMHDLIEPTIKAMNTIGSPFTGILFAGLMITGQGPKLVEYNVRFGDPECQTLMMRLKSDLLPLLFATAEGRLAECIPEWSDDVSLSIVLAAKGYPEAPEKGAVIYGIQDAEQTHGVRVFHAGTALKNGELIANGGRVLNITSRGKTITEAQQRAYTAIEKIHLPGSFYRTDIGSQSIKPQD